MRAPFCLLLLTVSAHAQLANLFTIGIDNGSTINLNSGTNYLELNRSGGTTNTWLAIDTLSVDLDPTALQDSDNDGLPMNWETLYQLCDNDRSDASADLDGDTLTALQEFTEGRNPRIADSDSDGDSDGWKIRSAGAEKKGSKISP